MSTTSEIPPSARPSTSDPPSGPIYLFDTHLRYLTDSYINFFQERKKIEDIYVESLKKLHHKCKTIDAWLDDRNEPNTTRGAWTEVRDNLQRETISREGFADHLLDDVITPLVIFKETQERIRKRIREDLKEAISAHSDYVENVYPKLKRTYLKKSQDVEDFKTAAAAAPPLSPTTEHHHNPFSPPKSTSGAPTKPIVTAPQPLRPLDRRPSGSVPVTRNRSPSSSTALQDLAHQGKKQLNQLMTFLDKGGVKDTSAGRSDNALRSVRAKREADEANKEYRKAVHWLETLRLRRVKILESGYNSVETLVHESSETVKKVSQIYADMLTATHMTQAQLAAYLRGVVDKISPEKDVNNVTTLIPRLLATSTPKPLYYYNYSIGECRDLIFGVSLVDYATARGLPDGEVPKIVKLCIDEVERRGMEAEGIYRVSGRHAAVQDLQYKIERNEALFAFHAPQDDVFAVATLLKLYLRELPEPVFKFPLQDRIQHTGDLEEHISSNFQLLRSKIRRLPPVHQATLKAIVEHLSRVAAKSDKNKMDARNLAIVFGSVIFGEDEMPKGGDLLIVQSWKDTLMEDLISNAPILFQSTQSPPLPPAPLDEPATVTYGSSHTRIANVPPALPPRSPSPRYPQQDSFVVPPLPPRPTQSEGPLSVPPQDFTPKLPPRPTNSIHPSLRAGPMSASPARQSLPPPSRTGQFFDDIATPYAHLSPPPSSTSPSAFPSLPPSPTKRDKRDSKVPSSSLSLPSPFSETSSSLNLSIEPSIIALTIENAEGEEVSHIPAADDGPPSAPSSATTFESAMTSALEPSSVPRPLPTATDAPPVNFQNSHPPSPSVASTWTSTTMASDSNHSKGASTSTMSSSTE